jgi:hypothetical protein
MNTNTRYRHTQVGLIIPAVVVGILLIIAFGGFEPEPGQFIVIAVLVMVLALFYSLTVEVADGMLRCHFGPGLIRRRFLLSEVEDARGVRNPWYSGLGIRWMPGRYVLWNVSGFKAVEIILPGGKRFRIGTDEPEKLLQAIHNGRVYHTTIIRKEI